MRIPNHIGVIPDGNRRWAQFLGMEKHEGYHYGLLPGLKLLRLAQKMGIKEITYYGFTTDNCKRPKNQYLSFTKACIDAIKLIEKENVSLLVVGNTESPMFPTSLLPYTKRTPMQNPGTKVNFLVNYGWEWDISELHANTKNRNTIMDSLKSKDISRIDLIIRWGGRKRLSGFLPIQSVYADIYTIDELWPDFCEKHFYDALEWYSKQDITLGG